MHFRQSFRMPFRPVQVLQDLQVLLERLVHHRDSQDRVRRSLSK